MPSILDPSQRAEHRCKDPEFRSIRPASVRLDRIENRLDIHRIGGSEHESIDVVIWIVGPLEADVGGQNLVVDKVASKGSGNFRGKSVGHVDPRQDAVASDRRRRAAGVHSNT